MDPSISSEASDPLLSAANPSDDTVQSHPVDHPAPDALSSKSAEPSIEVKDLSISFENLASKPMLATRLLGKRSPYNLASELRPPPPVINALTDINLSLKGKARLGLIGANGAGKTTLLRTLAGVYVPSQGSIRVQGIVRSLLNMTVGLNMDLSPRENIVRMANLAGQGDSDLGAMIEEIAAFTELTERFQSPIRGFSSGMLTRLVFGIQTALYSDILLMDEWIATGDMRFHQRASDRLASLVKRTPMLVLASHSEPLIKEWCDRAIFLNAGNVIADGKPDEVWAEYAKSAAAS